MTPHEALRHYWHYDTFRPMQEEIINAVLEGHDTLALLPTGGGKSLCYQIPTMTRDGMTLVVSPLIALMRDQVQHLRQRHIPAACIISGMHTTEKEAVLNNCVFGKIKMLYVSPERLKSRLFLEHFKQMPIRLIAVDEAHCISQWGYDFRPPYLEIARIRQYHSSAPVIALTATATPEVVADIQHQLEFRNARLFQNSFARPNLSYSVIKCDDKQSRLLRIAKNVGGSGIVYVRNRRLTAEIANLLNDNGIAATHYHAGLTQKERDERQRQWQKSRQGVMVATNAFGMGIDKSDVRFIVHLDLPDAPEAYFQEAGRAGRDGKRAYAVLLYDNSDIARLREGLERDFPPLSHIKNVYRAICNYYQIPVGAGTDSRFDFNIEELCKAYSLDLYTCFVATKFLEREGLIELPEHNELQSHLRILTGKEELMRVQESHRQAGDLLATTLRLYGGLFTDYVAISEQQIAQRTGLTETNVANILTELDRLDIVAYRKRTLKPQIIFTSPRININDLHISDRNYKELKKASQARREAMIAYALNDSECRSRQLLRYFGEENSSECGICDACIAIRHSAQCDPTDEILEILNGEEMTIKQLVARLQERPQEHVVETVRRLLDKGVLAQDDDFRLSVRKS